MVLKCLAAALIASLSSAALAQSLPSPNAQYMPQVTTQPANDNSNRAASTGYVDRATQTLSNGIASNASAILAEQTRATAAEGSLAPLANPLFSGSISNAATAGYWLRNTPAASPVANFVRLNDRIIIGKDAQSWSGAYNEAGTDYPWTMGQGIFGYLPRNAMTWAANPYGTIAGLFSSRTGDSGKLPGVANSGCCAIPVASLLLNDNTAIPQDAWNYYGTAVKTAGAGNTHNIELDVLNATNTVSRITPYTQDPGITLGISINAGGEGAPYNNPSNPPYPQTAASTVAMQIFGNGTTFDKGIVVKSAAISPTGDGQTVAMELPANNVVRWMYGGGGGPVGLGAFLNSSVSGAATSNGLNFTDSGALFQSGAGTLYAQVNVVANAVNRIALAPSIAGQPVQVAALGSDANIDLQLAPKGTGRAIAPNLTATTVLTPPIYVAAALPPGAPTGSIAYCSDCREPGQATGAGTGILAFKNASGWRSTAGGQVLN